MLSYPHAAQPRRTNAPERERILAQVAPAASRAFAMALPTVVINRPVHVGLQGVSGKWRVHPKNIKVENGQEFVTVNTTDRTLTYLLAQYVHKVGDITGRKNLTFSASKAVSMMVAQRNECQSRASEPAVGASLFADVEVAADVAEQSKRRRTMRYKAPVKPADTNVIDVDMPGGGSITMRAATQHNARLQVLMTDNNLAQFFAYLVQGGVEFISAKKVPEVEGESEHAAEESEDEVQTADEPECAAEVADIGDREGDAAEGVDVTPPDRWPLLGPIAERQMQESLGQVPADAPIPLMRRGGCHER
jgi:hypothetical protein